MFLAIRHKGRLEDGMNSEAGVGEAWMALIIGNSRLHWAWFMNGALQLAWDTNHHFAPLSEDTLLKTFPDPVQTSICQQNLETTQWPFELWMASVVPAQTAQWRAYPRLHEITLDQIPLQAVYPTLGIDRALALWGGLTTESCAALVIDAGTALTLTGGDQAGRLIGGAILPGLQLQLRSLANNTGALPLLDTRFIQQLPHRWATDTSEAIQSGVVYTVLAGLKSFIDDWRQTFSDSAIVVTGGDSAFLHRQLKTLYPNLGDRLSVDPYLIFRGMAAIRNRDEVISTTDNS